MMFKFFRKTLILLSIGLIANTSMFCMSNQKEEIKAPPTKADPKDIYQQQIDCPEMKALNTFLFIKPIYALKLKRTYTAVMKALNDFEPKETASEKASNASAQKPSTSKAPTLDPIKSTDLSTDNETKKILKARDEILKDANGFFTQLYDHQTLLGGLVSKIFKQTKFATTTEELDKTIMLQFFQVDKQTAQTFFNDIMVKKEILLKVCKEFEALFGVVNASLSTDVKKAAEEEEKKAIADHIKKLKIANQKAKEATKPNLDTQKKPEQK